MFCENFLICHKHCRHAIQTIHTHTHTRTHLHFALIITFTICSCAWPLENDAFSRHFSEMRLALNAFAWPINIANQDSAAINGHNIFRVKCLWCQTANTYTLQCRWAHNNEFTQSTTLLGITHTPDNVPFTSLAHSTVACNSTTVMFFWNYKTNELFR